MFVGSDKAGNFRQRSLCQNQSIVPLVHGEKSLVHQALRKLLGDAVSNGDEVVGRDFPFEHLPQRRFRQNSFCWLLSNVRGDQSDFLNNRRDHKKSKPTTFEMVPKVVGKILLVR